MIEDQLLAELAALRAEVHGLRDKVASLELENTTLSDNQLIQLRLIHALKEKKPGKTELSRRSRGIWQPGRTTKPLLRRLEAIWGLTRICSMMRSRHSWPHLLADMA